MSLTINKQSISQVDFGFVPEFNGCFLANPETKQTSREKIVKLPAGVTDMITRLKAKGAGENYLVEPQMKAMS